MIVFMPGACSDVNECKTIFLQWFVLVCHAHLIVPSRAHDLLLACTGQGGFNTALFFVKQGIQMRTCHPFYLTFSTLTNLDNIKKFNSLNQWPISFLLSFQLYPSFIIYYIINTWSKNFGPLFTKIARTWECEIWHSYTL